MNNGRTDQRQRGDSLRRDTDAGAWSTRKGGRPLLLALALVAGILVLAACGGSGSDSGPDAIASAADVETAEEPPSAGGESGTAAADASGSDTASTDAASDNEAPDNLQDAVLELATCLRDQGLDVSDPDFSGGAGPGGRGFFGGEIDPNDPDVQAALEACGSAFENLAPDFEPEDQVAFQDQILELTKCLREQGLDVPDPDFSGGFGEGGAFRSALDPNDPQVQAALEQCRDLLPSFGGRGPGAGN